MLRVTSVSTGRIYAKHVIRPNNSIDDAVHVGYRFP